MIVEIWNKPLEKEIEVFLDWLQNQGIVQQQLYDITWISGSSTTVYPITVCQSCVEIQWKEDNEPKALIDSATALFTDIISYGVFSKTDGSCPSTVHFQLKEPRY